MKPIDLSSSDSREGVAVIYDVFPHYRKGVIEELAASDRYRFLFFCDERYRDSSIVSYEFKPQIDHVRTQSFWIGPLYFQQRILRGTLTPRISHCIFLGNPWFVSYWLLTPILRLFGKHVYFWSHGWLSREEPFLRRMLKSMFFSLPNGLLLYGRRAKNIGLSRGFAASRLHVVGNSLDYGTQKAIFERLTGLSRAALRSELDLPVDCRIIICTARLTRNCRFDILLQAVSALIASNSRYFILLVGDGPEKESLEALALSLEVPHRFAGACYDETVIARLFKASDLTVSPGKVGLTAMHSMAYGTPVISHGNFDHQMPEVEAIIPGVTGDVFTENSSEDLARVITAWFDHHPIKPERECIDRIESEFTPAFQKKVIEATLSGRALET
jgi:glycosyltransferase involved in cell wall biosynthesis